ncbi:MAG: type III pantothenate kinase [Bacteroidales bacterium]|nr:type III pantothenate kinase [Bacteroidales bacterium]
MANLIIDLGNTALKFFVFDEQTILHQSIVEDYDIFLSDIIHIISRYELENAIVSSVRGDDKDFIVELKRTINILQMNANLKLPVELLYETPQTLGQDRLAAVCGASVLYPNENILVIDVGTAITYDILTADNKYLGGTISPGIFTRFKSLHNFTGKLPLLGINKKLNGVYGKTTNEAIILGVQNGIMNEVDGVISAFNDKFNNLLVVFTGGDSFFFDSLIKNRIFVVPNLTVFGLNKILKLNV